MKHIKTSIIALLAACLLLAGCNSDIESKPDQAQNGSSTTQSSSDTDTSKPNASQLTNPNQPQKPTETEKPEKLTETEQIFRLMKDYADLYYGMQPSGAAELEKITDKSNKIVIDGRSYPYLKLTNAPANTVTLLEEKLHSLVTKKLKNEFLDSVTNDSYHYQIVDDDIYVTEECFAYGMGMGMDKLYLNSIEYPDENTVLVNMTSFGDKSKWETENDIKDKFTIKLVRTGDGLKIDECDLMSVAYLYYYHEISYGDISFSF